MNYDKEFDFLFLLSQVDEKYIHEAETDNLQRKVRHRKYPIAIAAAVILSAMLGIGASAAIMNYLSHKENAAHEYDNNSVLISELEKRAKEPIICENEHLRLTVDTIMADEIYIRATATLEGIDDVGKRFISNNLILPEDISGLSENELKTYFETAQKDTDQFIPYMILYSETGQQIAAFNTKGDNMYGQKGEKCEATFTFGINRSSLNGEKSVRVECNQLKTYFSKSDAHNAGIFENMRFVMPVESNFDTLILEASDNNNVIYLSETCFYENKDATENDDISFSVFYKSGESRDNITTSFTAGELYKLKDIDYIKYNNECYYPIEIIEADNSDD